ncbi:MAG: hypothetical protein ABFR62_01600 [Bacteroidota bacterium]
MIIIKNNMMVNRTFFFIVAMLGLSLSMRAQDSNFFESKNDTTAFVQIIQDPDINTINKLYKEASSSDTIVDGFKIQVYYGNRKKASEKIIEFKELYPDIEANLIYEEPNFKAVVGKYYRKLDADRDLQRIKKKFNDAFIIRNKISK